MLAPERDSPFGLTALLAALLRGNARARARQPIAGQCAAGQRNQHHTTRDEHRVQEVPVEFIADPDRFVMLGRCADQRLPQRAGQG